MQPSSPYRDSTPQVTEVLHLGAIARSRDCRENMRVGLAQPTALEHGKRGAMESAQLAAQTGRVNEQDQESRNIRRLQVMISMVMSVISQDPSLTVEEASAMAANAKRAALAMFPDKELAYDLLYKPRLQRLMNERYRLQ
jgi:hypothetical protein